MSKPRKKCEREVQKTLSELDHPDMIQASPWFHARTMTRIHALEEAGTAVSLWTWGRRWLRPALVAAIIVLNIAVTAQVWVTEASGSSQTSRTKSAATQLSSLAVEYGYQSSSDVWGLSEK